MRDYLAMVQRAPGAALVAEQRDLGAPGPGEVRVAVEACAVCRTDLHVQDGDLAGDHYPVVPGHEVVGRVAAVGRGVGLAEGDRVGIPWLGGACSTCRYCAAGAENLCDAPTFTGWTRDGGFAEQVLARADFCLPLPDDADPVATAPLLCAGLIGWRTLRMAGDAEHVGLYGFGAAAHILAQVLSWQQRPWYAFTRPGDAAAQDFARRLGAAWAGDSGTAPPVELDAALLFAPVGGLVPEALRRVRKGGVVVCGGIHMSDIPGFPYRDLWGERQLRSVANLTRADALEFLALAPRVPVRTETQVYPLREAQRAMDDLREGRLSGAAVLVPSR